MKKYLVLAVVLGLSGCQSMDVKVNQMMGFGVITDAVDRFDGARRVEMTPALVATGTSEFAKQTMYVKVGAFWSSKYPDLVMMPLSIDLAGGDYIGFRGVEIKVNGVVKEYRVAQTDLVTGAYDATTGKTKSSVKSSFTVSKSDFLRYINGDNAMIRVLTNSGSMIGDLSIAKTPNGTATYKTYVKGFTDKLGW